jgi:hypothetical protein
VILDPESEAEADGANLPALVEPIESETEAEESTLPRPVGSVTRHAPESKVTTKVAMSPACVEFPNREREAEKSCPSVTSAFVPGQTPVCFNVSSDVLRHAVQSKINTKHATCPASVESFTWERDAEKYCPSVTGALSPAQKTACLDVSSGVNIPVDIGEYLLPNSSVSCDANVVF